ncbi:MAG: IPT/TIG domain-containing protein [Anaerolineales bacterium]|nr:IPT/TIG domain-containing protein [Anaerolineales bacterium]MDW8227264.1 IPT/TIG domain-containing protein [Anaerolineales bacterium]
MKNKLALVVLLSGMLLLSLATPLSAQAALTVASVSPMTVVNSASTTITVTGTDFTPAAIVRLDANILPTTYVSATTLTAVVPAGFAPGVYDVSVDVPGVGSATLMDALTVQAPPATPTPFARPQVVIDSYSTNSGAIVTGQEFVLSVSLDNAGGSTAYGIQVTFTSPDLLMLRNGGVIAAGNLGVVGKVDLSQAMIAVSSLTGKSLVIVEMNVIYYDQGGTSYSEKFTLYLPVAQRGGGGGGAPVRTPTPTMTRYSRLVITTYRTDVETLQPGTRFRLLLTVENVGTLGARDITMVVGGVGSSSGTPSPGVSAGGGEFNNFAPVGTSNVKVLGNLEAGGKLEAGQDLIVNVSTNPGAYPMKISFLYTNANGIPVVEEQVITLLVYRLPQVEIGFYQPLDTFYVGQPGLLPIQVINQGKHSCILGMMKVTTTAGTVENGQAMVGALETGGYFPLDALFTPEIAGLAQLTVTVGYLDDFNQLRQVTQTLTVEVLESPSNLAPAPEEDVELLPTPSEETFWQKVWRFLLGLLGLDSGVRTPTPVPEVPVPLPSGSRSGKG